MKHIITKDNFTPYNESIFFKTFKDLIYDIREDIINLKAIRFNIITWHDAYDGRPGFLYKKIFSLYKKYYNYRIIICEKILNLLKKKYLNQENLNIILIHWNNFEKEMNLVSYDLKIKTDREYLKKTVNLLNMIRLKFDDLKTDYVINSDTNDSFTFYSYKGDYHMIGRESKKNEILKKLEKKKQEHIDVDPFGEDNWE